MNQNENFLEYLQDNGSFLDENEWYDSINKNEEEDDDLKAAVESQGESESSQSQQLLVQLDKIFQDELERRSKYAKVVFAVVLICGGKLAVLYIGKKTFKCELFSGKEDVVLQNFPSNKVRRSEDFWKQQLCRRSCEVSLNSFSKCQMMKIS